MNQQEIDRLWDSADGSLSSKRWGFGVVTEWRGFTKDQLTAAIQEAVAQARRQALEEAAALCSLAVASYADRMNMPGEARGAVACAAEIRALMAQETGE